MRELKFRGLQSTPSGKIWRYGSLIIRPGTATIQTEEYFFYVDPETVGQYTGLKDKNGTELYEGDIVQDLQHFGCITTAGCHTDEYPDKRIIIWESAQGAFNFAYFDKEMPGSTSGLTLCRANARNHFEVISNIHEDSE